jgi:predicted GNAT family N-acyltransferase
LNRASVDEYGYEWRVETPFHLGSLSSKASNERLAELWEMRGRIIYQNGYRPSFRSPDGKFSDEDPLDALSFHVTVRLNGTLVGCVRLIRYIDAPMTWAQRLLGKPQIEAVLNTLARSLVHTGECGRWIVEPKQRGKHLGRYLISGVYATARAFNVKTILGLSGTHERQDLAFMSMGWKP